MSSVLPAAECLLRGGITDGALHFRLDSQDSQECNRRRTTRRRDQASGTIVFPIRFSPRAPNDFQLKLIQLCACAHWRALR